jgi:hypothetical protein
LYLAEIAPANRGGASAGLFQVNIVIGILLAHGSNSCVARFIAGAEARRYELAVSTLPATLLFTAYRHYLRLIATAHRARRVGAFPVIAAHSKSAPFAFFARMMVLQFIAAFFLMPETRGVALERVNQRLRMWAQILAPQYVMPRTMFAVLDD